MMEDRDTYNCTIRDLVSYDMEVFGVKQIKKIGGMWTYNDEEVDPFFVEEYRREWRRQS